MIRPFVKLTSSRICDISSHPARLTAGVMNFVQMSRSLRAVLSMPEAVQAILRWESPRRTTTSTNVELKFRATYCQLTA